jgi:hypothetical protein
VHGAASRKLKKTHFEFWYSIINFEILVLSFIRSLRESDFELYKETLSFLIPYLFGLDHVNYSRWLPIHLRDMVSLESKHPIIYREFAKGNITIRKSTRVFSNMAIDQAHEQSNAVVKGDGGAIGLTEDSTALRGWMVAGRDSNSEKHHEYSPAAQKDFWNKIQRVRQVFIYNGNHFQEESTDIFLNWIQKRSSNSKLVKLLTYWKQDQDNTTTSNPDLPT